MHNEFHCLSILDARTKWASPHHFLVTRSFLWNKKSTQNVPIQKNGFFRHREPVQNPSVFKSLVLFKDRMVTNCLMRFCLAIPCRQIACLRGILPHWECICKGKINFHHDKRWMSALTPILNCGFSAKKLHVVYAWASGQLSKENFDRLTYGKSCAAACACLLPWYFMQLIHADFNSSSSFWRLYDNGNLSVSMPFKLIGFTRSLSDKGLPGDVYGYLGVAVPDRKSVV